jgi:DNA-binding XRE family transcriptional regulator
MNTDNEVDVKIYNEGWNHGYQAALEWQLKDIAEALGGNALEALELRAAVIREESSLPALDEATDAQWPSVELSPESLRFLRQLRGVTLKDASEAMGLSLSFLSDIERGKTNPSVESLHAIANYYRCSLVVPVSGGAE